MWFLSVLFLKKFHYYNINVLISFRTGVFLFPFSQFWANVWKGLFTDFLVLHVHKNSYFFIHCEHFMHLVLMFTAIYLFKDDRSYRKILRTSYHKNLKCTWKWWKWLMMLQVMVTIRGGKWLSILKQFLLMYNERLIIIIP